jgi:hypothetical protein
VRSGTITRDIVSTNTFGRQTNYADGGSTELLPMVGRAATGQTSYVTRDMVRSGAGTEALRSIKPPGWDDSRAYGAGGNYDLSGLVRFHLKARELDGLGNDARDIVTATQRANLAMRGIEAQVKKVADGGEAVWCYVAPYYGNGFDAMPTQFAVMAVGVRGGVIVFRLIDNV